MSVPLSRLPSLTGASTVLSAAFAVLSLAACKPPAPPQTPPAPTTEIVTPNVVETPAASDRPEAGAPPAIGAMNPGQAGGATHGPAQPTAGDGAASRPASSASR